MLLSEILPRMRYETPYRIDGERAFEALALCVSNLSKDSLIFLDSEEYLCELRPNVRMVLTNEALSARLLEKGVGVCVSREPRVLFFLLHNFLSSQPEYTRARFQTLIGRDCTISPLSCVAAENVRIGDRVVIEEFVTIRENTVIGDDVILRAGTRIGGLGFEFKRNGGGILAVEHAGGVVIENKVEIRQNTCIDRAIYPWDDTVIGENSKIDNLVMIGHNCVIGRNNLMAAHTGISGSVTSGDNCIFGGRAGVGDHITIGEGARVAAGGGVLADIPPGETWSGYPAKPLRQSLREAIWLAKQASQKKGAKES